MYLDYEPNMEDINDDVDDESDSEEEENDEEKNEDEIEEAKKAELYKKTEFVLEKKAQLTWFEKYHLYFVEIPCKYIKEFMICSSDNPKMETMLKPIIILISGYLTYYQLKKFIDIELFRLVLALTILALCFAIIFIKTHQEQIYIGQ